MSTEPGFFDKVYRIVAMVPEGSVITYGMIANMIGNPRASRVVGYAMHGAPEHLHLPCHRVVSKSGQLSAGEIFGEGRQRKMLEEEGITFLENGCVDMKKHLIRWGADIRP